MGRILIICFIRAGEALRAFPLRARKAVEAAVRASESTHSGELRFVVEGGPDMAYLLRGGELPPAGGELFHKPGWTGRRRRAASSSMSSSPTGGRDSCRSGHRFPGAGGYLENDLPPDGGSLRRRKL